ncbi:cytochrome P450 [Xylariomycetidae sp. FL0641]|nr:cytochrome P450 [Xylariomycetidae sp. FL0641]
MASEDSSLFSAGPAAATPATYLVITFLAIGLYALYRQLLPRPLPGIPYNAAAASSVLGDGLSMARSVGTTGEFGPWLAAQLDRAGAPLCQVFVRPLAPPWILLADYREAHDLLAHRTAPARGDGVDFDKSGLVTGGIGCLPGFHAAFRAAAEADGADRFRHNRALLQDLMTPTFLHGVMGPAVRSKGLLLVRLLDAKMHLAAGRPFDVKADLDRVALDNILHFAFGPDFVDTSLGPVVDEMECLAPTHIPDGHRDQPVPFPEPPPSAFIAAIGTVPAVIEGYIFSSMPRLKSWWWKKQPWYRRAFSDGRRVIREQFKEARERDGDAEARSATDHMLKREEREAEKQGRAPNPESSILVDELFGQILAGTHTTGGALGWVLKYLTGYQELQRKLRKSLLAALPQAIAEQRPPTFEELRRAQLPYLDAFIEETLRLNTIAVGRETIRDTTILGRHVPKGCQVFLVSNGPDYVAPSLDVRASKRDQAAQGPKSDDHWNEMRDLRLFDPERWLVHKNEGDLKAEFNPSAAPQLVFGHGVRGCWGKRLAQMELRTVIALLVWHFMLLPIPPTLAGHGATEGVARRPRKVFVRLEKVVHTQQVDQ